MLCPLLIAGMASAKDITIYVQADQSPKLWFWGDATNSTGWPGEALTQTTQVQNPTTGATQTFYYKTFTGLAENASISMLISYNGDSDKTSDINGITSDRYFWYKGNKQYEDITEQYTAVPDATISSLTITGGIEQLTSWGDGVAFTTVTANAEYTYELDLTDVTSDVEFKIRPNGGWVGIGNATLVAADGLVTGTDNFILKNSTSGYKTYTITATWAGGKDASAGWTLKVEGDEPRTEPIVNTYTVAGTPDAIFGNVWDPAYTANDMTENNGIYTFTKTGVELTAGDEIMFKVVLNHSWETSYGTAEGNDVYYKVNVTGSHDITITFDPEVGIPEIALTDDEPADSYTVKFVNIAGWNDVYVYGWNGSTNSGWTANKAEKTSTVNVFGVDADVYECTISLSVEPKNLIFHNNDGTQTQDLQWVEGATYSYDDTEKGYFLFTDDADQFKPAENIDVAGAKASYARKFTPNNVCTVVLPFAIGYDAAQAAGKFYRINSIADGYIRGTEETPAPYVPYIFIPAKDYPFTNIGIGQLPEVQNNSITTAEGYTLQFVTETTELASDASYDYYGFSNGKFVKAAYATVNPFRSYIKVAKSANAPATLIWTDDEATGISSLKADIQNGKADVYDLQGRRVLNPVRGLYIVNGKKVIVK